MASLGESMKKGQTAMVCQLCENDPRMKWKCLDCSLMMCQRCREKVHPKFPGAADHTILDLKEIGTAAQPVGPKLDFTKIPCQSHAGQNTCLFCTKCNKLVCPSCVSQAHNRHELIEINQAYDMKIDNLKKLKTDVEKNLNMVTERLNFVFELHAFENPRYELTKESILEYEDRITEICTREKKRCKELVNALDEQWSKLIICFGKDRKQLHDQEKAIKTHMDKIDEIITSTDVNRVFSPGQSLKDIATPIKLPNITMPRMPTFVAQELVKPKSELVPVKEPFHSNLSIVNEYSTGMIVLLEADDGTIWMKDPNVDELTHVKPEGGSLHTITKLNIGVHCVAQQQNGDLIISDGSPVLKKIKKNSEKMTSTKFDFSPYNAVAIHVLNDSKFIVGVREKGDNPYGKIYIVNQNGMKEKIFEKDENNAKLFSYVYRIASNSRQMIAVIDHIPGNIDHEGRIILIGLNGKLKCIFTGHRLINGKNPFKPISLVSTASDNFVISDYWNYMLVILNSDGDLMTFVNTSKLDFNIGSPVSMVIRKNGNVYVGSYDTSKEVAKLCEIANFPW